jgi:uncharacterized protein YbjT (DUF2867 family)
MEKHENILIIGATGQQGGAITRELLGHGYRVKAMTRNPKGKKAQAIENRGAEIIYGDLDDAQSLEHALKGA